MNGRLKYLTKLFSIFTMMVFLVTGCGNKNERKTSEGKKDISIMTVSFTSEPATMDSEIIKQLEEKTNTNLEVTFVPQSSYDEKFNVTLASGELPTIIWYESKSASLISAVKADAFWEIGPYLKDYEYLSKANKDILKSLEINGKTYGIYRGRPYGRRGIVIRQDWLKNLGLEEPKTIEDFYNVIKMFTLNDPDKDGKNDTYGLELTSGLVTIINAMATWFGAPNNWGLDDDGNLIPAFMTDEYLDTVNFVKKLYDEGLVNEDFAIAPVIEGIQKGDAGIRIATVDDAIKYVDSNQELKDSFTTLAGVEDKSGQLRICPTTGYSGMFLIPKSSVKDETQLKEALQFLDDLCKKDIQVLLNNGIEGRNFEKDGDGVVYIQKDDVPSNERNDLDQLAVSIPSKTSYDRKSTPLMKSIENSYKVAEENAIPDIGAAYISKTYTNKGAQLDDIIKDSITKYVVGQIDEKGLSDAKELWRKSGGDEIIKEMSEAYKADENKIDYK